MKKNKNSMLFIFDWDGTLGGRHCSLSNDNAKAIKILNDLGHEVIIATGRHPREISRLLGDNKNINKYIIGGNGSLILDNNSNEIIFIKTIPDKYKYDIIKMASNHVTLIGYMDKEEVTYISHHDKKNLKNELTLMAIYLSDYNLLLDKFKELKNKYSNHLSITLAEKNLIQFMAKDVDKWEAIKWLKNHTENNNAKTITFGDALNDYNMIKNADFSVAMGNSHEKIIEISDYLIGDCDGSSILEFVNKFKENPKILNK